MSIGFGNTGNTDDIRETWAAGVVEMKERE